MTCASAIAPNFIFLAFLSLTLALTSGGILFQIGSAEGRNTLTTTCCLVKVLSRALAGSEHLVSAFTSTNRVTHPLLVFIRTGVCRNALALTGLEVIVRGSRTTLVAALVLVLRN